MRQGHHYKVESICSYWQTPYQTTASAVNFKLCKHFCISKQCMYKWRRISKNFHLLLAYRPWAMSPSPCHVPLPIWIIGVMPLILVPGMSMPEMMLLRCWHWSWSAPENKPGCCFSCVTAECWTTVPWLCSYHHSLTPSTGNLVFSVTAEEE